jgi:hypothetical protein
MDKTVCFRYSLHIQKFLESEFHQRGVIIILNPSTTLFAQCLPITTLSIVQMKPIGRLFPPQPYFHDVSFSRYLLSFLALHWSSYYATIKR